MRALVFATCLTACAEEIPPPAECVDARDVCTEEGAPCEVDGSIGECYLEAQGEPFQCCP